MKKCREGGREVVGKERDSEKGIEGGERKRKKKEGKKDRRERRKG